MVNGLIRVRDFAESCGCTPQNIYLHLKNYAAELEGHTIQGKGRQGILLDEYAQEYLRSIMYPKELGDNALMDEINKLRGAIVQASQENARLAARLAAAEGERDRAILESGQLQRLLTASEEAERAKDTEIGRMKVDVAAFSELAKEARKEADDLHLALEQEKAHNAALENRGLLARIMRKGERHGRSD